MKKLFYLLIFFSCIILTAESRYRKNPLSELAEIDVSKYYAALASTDTIKINAVLKSLEPVNTTLQKAYSGALTMKKSGLVNPAKRKLELFKAGRLLLEDVIAKENQNAEFRFLRLIIQENCPDIVRYKKNIKQDAEMVKSNYTKFPAEVKQAVMDYAKNSASLKSIVATDGK